MASPGSTGCSKWKLRFVTPPADVITTTITTSGWSLEHLHSHDRRRLQRRRRHEREQTGHLREHLRRRLERVLDLGALGVQVERELGRRARLGPSSNPSAYTR